MTGTTTPGRGLRSLSAAMAAVVALLGVVASNPTSAPVRWTTTSAASTVQVDPAVPAALADAGFADVIVQGAHGSAAAREAVTDNGGTTGATLPIIEGFGARVTLEALAALVEVPGVRTVSIDASIALAHEPPPGEAGGDHRYDEVVGASQLRGAGIDGSGVGIAIIDTGVSPVTDLAGRIVGGVDLSGEGTTADSYGHGTFVAGIAAGNGAASGGDFAGIAPGAHVVPVKIAGADGAADISHVLAAIQWVVSFKDTYDIDVLNLSLGTDSRQPNALSPLNYAVERAWDSGIVVVVSAGNNGEDGPGHLPKPADDPLVITVGATDSQGTVDPSDDTVAAYSSRGPSIADRIVKPDVVAPGSHLIGTTSPGSYVDVTFPEASVRNGYLRGSGTSFAAAVVSGGAALLLDAHPTWTPDEVKGAITATAAPGPVGDRNVDGHGALDLVAAAALTSPVPANQGVVRSTGQGSLAADRGSLVVEVDGGSHTLLLSSALDLDAQGDIWNPGGYVTGEWTDATWYGSKWYGSKWYGSKWYGSKWYGSKWYGSKWYGSKWYADAWD